MSELEDLRAEVARLREEKDDAVAMLKAWFEIKSLAKDAMEPEFIGGVRGYLRTSRNGGMPQEQSDLVEMVLEEFARLYLVQTLWPMMLRIVEEHRDILKVPDHVNPRPGMTDEQIFAAIKKNLDNTPKMPVNVSDMNDHEREFFKVIAYQSGMLLFLHSVFVDRLRSCGN